MKTGKILGLLIVVFLVTLTLTGCKQREEAGDTNVSVPRGDPPFTPLGESWVIDNVGVIKEETEVKGDAICQSLKEDRVAEMVVLIQNGIKQPETYATHYGRWLEIGEEGRATRGGADGFVWIIRPDAEKKMTYSAGRGLPKLTAIHLDDILIKGKEYFDVGDFDGGVMCLITETDKQLRELYE